MSNAIIHEIGIFAERRSVPVAHAHTLVSIFERASEMTGRPVREIVNQATYFNAPLADYIKEVAETVAAECPA